eukprot:scaffold38372_cov58-Phaeocystis_antarctica.AAC.2
MIVWWKCGISPADLTRPSREGRAEGGVCSGPLLILHTVDTPQMPSGSGRAAYLPAWSSSRLPASGGNGVACFAHATDALSRLASAAWAAAGSSSRQVDSQRAGAGGGCASRARHAPTIQLGRAERDEGYRVWRDEVLLPIAAGRE